MAQARQADRAFPQAVIFYAAALVAAMILGAIVAIGPLNLFGSGTPAVDQNPVSPALMQAGQEWELQRKQQGGYVDPLTQAGRDWEVQRKQQGE